MIQLSLAIDKASSGPVMGKGFEPVDKRLWPLCRKCLFIGLSNPDCKTPGDLEVLACPGPRLGQTPE